jgi:hypothetical protein
MKNELLFHPNKKARLIAIGRSRTSAITLGNKH